MRADLKEPKTRLEAPNVPVVDRHNVPVNLEDILSLPLPGRARHRHWFISKGALRLVHRDQHILLPQHLACLAQGQDGHKGLDPAAPPLPHGTVGHPIEDGSTADQPGPRFISTLEAYLGDDSFWRRRDLSEGVDAFIGMLPQ